MPGPTVEWLDALALHDRAGTPSVLVTVVGARGSTPREAGAKMVVTQNGQHGTIGGGRLEQACTDAARDLLRDGGSAPVLRDFPLGPALGQCCGGHVQVLLEPVRPLDWQVVVFGAGHVGQALVRLLASLPCRVAWVDARAGLFPDALPATVQRHDALAVRDIRPGAQVLVMTHDHALDFRIVEACLARDDLPFVGLIGSETKAARFRSRLVRAGLTAARLTCPIGVPGAGGKLPAEIAVAVAAQLLQRRDAEAAPAMPANVHRLRAVPDCAVDGGTDCAGCAAL